MGKVFSSIFGGAPSVPEPKGPDPALLKAQADQQAALDKRNAEEERKLKSNRALIAARQGRAGIPTLNSTTGQRGVVDNLGGVG